METNSSTSVLIFGLRREKVTGIRLENFFAGEAKVEYEYGVTLNDIISTNLKVFADFDDGSSQKLKYGKYKKEAFTLLLLLKFHLTLL